eukprot:gene12092-16182_t
MIYHVLYLIVLIIESLVSAFSSSNQTGSSIQPTLQSSFEPSIETTFEPSYSSPIILSSIPSFQSTLIPSNILNTNQPSSYSVNSSQLQGLRDLYYSLNGFNWNCKIRNNTMMWNFDGNSDPCANNWVGVICTNAIISSFTVTGIDLNSCNLTGSIPLNIGDLLPTLNYFQLSNNRINGSIPTSLFRIKPLEILNLSNNLISGNIPNIDVSMNSIRMLLMGNNQLSGSVPASLIQLPLLNELDISRNNLSGMWPTSELAFTMDHLYNINLSHNKIYGHINSILSLSKQVEIIDVQNNLFYGSISNNISELTGLVKFYVNNNAINGKLPENMFSINSLQLVNLQNNKIVGNLPILTSTYSHLSVLNLSNNSISSTIPSTFISFSMLKLLDLSYNHLHGHLPVFSELFNPQIFVVNNNYLSGTLPSTLFSFDLEIIDISNNLFSGAIPIQVANSLQLKRFNASSNIMNNSIPRELFISDSLQVIDLANNHFSGELPTAAINSSRNLRVLYINRNQLLGSITNIIDPKIQTQIESVDLSDNLFTGFLPVQMFRSKTLKYFAAMKNCFYTFLSEDICESISLNTLILNNLYQSSDQQCNQNGNKKYGFQSILMATVNSNVVKTSTLPVCLLQMNQLKSLHLASNFIMGRLPDVPIISDSLTDISVSHNNIMGTIPSVYRSQPWINLDLSNNKIYGNIKSNFSNLYNNSRILLAENRLSGIISNDLIEIKHVNILLGNMFSCSYHKTEDKYDNQGHLPIHDPNRNKYHCGSNIMNISLYIWMGIISIIALILGIYFISVIHYTNHKLSNNIIISSCQKFSFHLWHWFEMSNIKTESISSNSTVNSLKPFDHTPFHSKINPFSPTISQPALLPPLNSITSNQRNSGNISNNMARPSINMIIINQFYHVCSKLRLVSIYLTIFTCWALLSIYVALNCLYSTYEYEYVWTTSALLLSGTFPGIAIVVLLVVFCCIQRVLFYKYIKLNHNKASNRLGGKDYDELVNHKKKKQTSNNDKVSLLYYLSVSLAIFINIIIISGCHSLYVYIYFSLNSQQYSSLLIFIQIITSLFLVVWNDSIVNRLPAIALLMVIGAYECVASIIDNHFDYQDDINFNYNRSGAFDQKYGFNQAEKSILKNQILSTQRKIFITLINNLFIPLIIVSIMSRNCFNSILFSVHKSISLSYTMPDSEGNAMYHSSSYSIPYEYSYQCSSEWIRIYASLFVFMYSFETISLPLTAMIYKILRFCQTKESNNDNNYYNNDESWFNIIIEAIIDHFIPNIIKSIQETKNLIYSKHQNTNNKINLFGLDASFTVGLNGILGVDGIEEDEDDHINSMESLLLNPMEFGCHGPEDDILKRHMIYSHLNNINMKKSAQFIIFDKEHFIVNTVNSFIILLTFGTIFPPLSFIIFLSILSKTYSTQLLIGRYIYESYQLKLTENIQLIISECEGVPIILSSLLYIPLIVAVPFYAIFIFDILGAYIETSLANYFMWKMIVSIGEGIGYKMTAYEDGSVWSFPKQRRNQELDNIDDNKSLGDTSDGMSNQDDFGDDNVEFIE